MFDVEITCAVKPVVVGFESMFGPEMSLLDPVASPKTTRGVVGNATGNVTTLLFTVTFESVTDTVPTCRVIQFVPLCIQNRLKSVVNAASPATGVVIAASRAATDANLLMT